MYNVDSDNASNDRLIKLQNIADDKKTLYHENVINAGLSTSGKSRCDAETVAMGKMATKSVMCQL